MRIAYTQRQEALRDELRGYFAELMTDEVTTELAHGEMGGPHSRAAIRRMGADGWLSVGWPVEHGGRGLGTIDQYIFHDEAWRAGAPVPFLTVGSIAPAIMQFGTERMRSDLLPRIRQGECLFAIGYTEPSAGTDLAALRTRAVRDGDEWVISGQKIYTSLTDHADYIWLACRTDPEAERHKGISLILVPTDAPGFSYTPIPVAGDAKTYATYYDNVRVPVTNTVGEPGRGWRVIVTQLNYERVALAPPGALERMYEDVRAYAVHNGLIDREWVRLLLARVHAEIAALRLLNWHVVWSDEIGAVNPADASATKVFGTTLNTRAYAALLEVLGPAGLLKRDSPGALLHGRLERACRSALILTFGGGTNEVQRDLIAMFGLGMPRSLR